MQVYIEVHWLPVLIYQLAAVVDTRFVRSCKQGTMSVYIEVDWLPVLISSGSHNLNILIISRTKLSMVQ